MSGDEDGKQLGKVPVFRLRATSGKDFEKAYRRAEDGLQAPLPTFRRFEEEEAVEAEVVPEAEAISDEAADTVQLQLTLQEGAALVSEFSGAQAIRAATPAEALEEETTAFREVLRSGVERPAETYQDWLAPVDAEDWSADAPVGGLTGDPAAPLLSDFSGADTMPQLPEREDPVFVNDGLPSLTAAEGRLLSEFSGSNLFGENEDEKQTVGGMSALDDVIFSSDPRQNEPELPRVTGRTEPEFLFKR